MFEVHVFKDQDQLNQKAFEVVHETLKEPHPVLGLATGSSPVGLYAKLVEAHKQGLSMDHVTTVNLDEYVGIDPNHPQSYRTFMFEHLFNHVDVPLEQIHLPKGQGALEPAVRNYEAFLAEHSSYYSTKPNLVKAQNYSIAKRYNHDTDNKENCWHHQ